MSINSQTELRYIPIDFLKATIIGLKKELFFEKFSFIQVLKEGSEIHFEKFEYQNILIKIYPSGRITLSGSLHKFSNNGLHNYNDFNEINFNNVIQKLFQIFGIKPENLNIIVLECGININPPIKTTMILNHILQHKRKDFENKISNVNGNYFVAIHNKFDFKIYDKSRQYKVNEEEILRVEIKYKNWSEWRKKGVDTLKDFIEYDKTVFLSDLLNRWNEIIFYNPLNLIDIQYHKYSNLNFWRDLNEKFSNKSYKKHSDRLKKLNDSSGRNIQDEVKNSLLEKTRNLQGVRNSELIENQKKSIKKCLLTGIDISMQKPKSHLLSHTGLYHLNKYNELEFKKIKRRYLNSQLYNSSLTVQVREIAHHIRSKYSFKTRNIDTNQLSMFQILDVVS